MGFTFNKKLPIPKEIKAMYPLSPENAAKKAQRDRNPRRDHWRRRPISRNHRTVFRR